MVNSTFTFTLAYQHGQITHFWALLKRRAELNADNTPIKKLVYKKSLTKHTIQPVVSAPYSITARIQWQQITSKTARFQSAHCKANPVKYRIPICSAVLEIAYT
jgi:hypothetical protein